jgi:hypothetical protein
MIVCGFALCAPQAGDYIGPALFAVTHTAHMRDFFGHLCFIAATSAVIYAATYRLSSQETHKLMCKVDRPGAAAGATMLIAITLSKSTRTWTGQTDFLDVPVDGWLTVYWLAYSALLIWMMGYAIWLMLWLRADPRSRVSANLFILAGVIGIIAVGIVVAHVVIGMPISPAWLWNLLISPAIVVGMAAIWRLWVRVRARRR